MTLFIKRNKSTGGTAGQLPSPNPSRSEMRPHFRQLKSSRRVRSRRGSSAVFLCVILSALVSICFAFIYSTIEYTTTSRADALMQLSGDSLLSEFDRDVLDEYGLFLLRGSDQDLSSKLRQYLLFTFGEEPSVTVSDVRASGASFTLTDPTEAEAQILACVKAGGTLFSGNTNDNDAVGSNGSSGPRISDTDRGRALRHGPTITSLPSRQLPKQSLLERVESIGEGLTDFKGILNNETNRLLLSHYVLKKFNSTTNTVAPNHFFYREAEYVLNGELSDRSNREKTALELTAIRLGPNLAHISTDPEKIRIVESAAALFPPVAQAAALLIIPSAWATAESKNDAELLMKGYKVPLTKTRDTWAIDLENILHEVEAPGDDGNKYHITDGETAGGTERHRTGATKKKTGDGVIHPRENRGLTYEQYLQVLMSFEDEDIITARILDLIQINMRKNVDGQFLISECCSGVAIRASVNRREYSYEKIYERLLYR